MYRQIYQHRVLLAADMLNKAVVQRARDIGDSLEFADETMKAALVAKDVQALTLPVMFTMRESWWRYHLSRWTSCSDAILRDLSDRIINRRLFKTVRIHSGREALIQQAREALADHDIDPRYYLHEISTADMHSGDTKQSMLVRLDNGTTITLAEADPLFKAMVTDARVSNRSWLAMPQEAKLTLNRTR
jgi:hypothetical protein